MRDTLASGDKATFKGLSGLTNISYNSVSKRWEMISLHELNGIDGRILGFTNATKFFPLGLQSWYMFEYCNKYFDQYMPTVLKITKVGN